MNRPVGFALTFAFLAPAISKANPTTQPAGFPHADVTADIGSRLELFADGWLLAKMRNARLELHRPELAETALRFDRPWEGPEAAYFTVLKDTDRYRLYYRGIITKDQLHPAATDPEFTCYAESPDGRQWTRPNLRLVKVNGSLDNNVLLANDAICHNFCPFIDTRLKCPPDQRYKAIGAGMDVGLIPLASSDGIHWKKLSAKPVFSKGRFDSHNVAFWSEAESSYVCYLRTLKRIGTTDYRWVSRTTSPDFLHWSEPVEMTVDDAPPTQYYTNQTHPYFRAPHLYIATPARFMQGLRVVPHHREKEINVPAQYAGDCSDGIFMTSRGGDHYTRLFTDAFVTPGPGLPNWVSRANYSAYGVVQTGPAEMSIYVQREYTLPGHRLDRLRMRLDGFVSVRADASGGEFVTRPLKFAGAALLLNYATSAAGTLRAELQDAAGRPIPGFTLEECRVLVGDDIEGRVRWGGEDVSKLAGQPMRVRVVMSDADVYAIRFR